ncbi:MAG: hypothetical protein U0T82_16045 [Bacteroidales bacterium]
MRKLNWMHLFLIITTGLFIYSPMNAQIQDVKFLMQEQKKGEMDQNEKDLIQLAATEYLINTRHFVFEADYGQEAKLVNSRNENNRMITTQASNEIFILVDSTLGMVQQGVRNNQEGKITRFEVKKNMAKKTISVNIKIKGSMGTADVALLLGPGGHGSAGVRADSYNGNNFVPGYVNDSPGYYNFDGQLRDISQALIYKGKSHLVH